MMTGKILDTLLPQGIFRHFVLQAGVALCYVLLAKLVLTFYSENGMVTVLWPSVGVALAAILLGGNRFWLGVFIGALIVELDVAGHSLGESLAISASATLEPLLAAWLLTRPWRIDLDLVSYRDFSRLLMISFILPSINAITGAIALLISGEISSQIYIRTLVHLWMGDTLGIALVTPLILVWRNMPVGWLHPSRALEVVSLLGVTFLFGQIIFLDWFHDVFGSIRLGYWMYLIITLGAIRLGRHGVLLILWIAIVQALTGAAIGTGFFGNDMQRTGLANLWFYIAVLYVVGMALATVLKERLRGEANLRKNESQFRTVVTALDEGLMLLDNEGRVLAVNPAGEKNLGLTLDEISSSDQMISKLQPIREDGKPFSYEDLPITLAFKRGISSRGVVLGSVGAGGAICWRSVNVTPIVDASTKNITNVVVAFTDITRQKRMEMEILARRSEMEYLQKKYLVAQTVAAIAHELNQPLLAVASYSEAALMLMNAEQPNFDKIRKAVEGSKRQAQRAGDSIRELLELLSIKEFSTEDFDLNREILDVLDDTRLKHGLHFNVILRLEEGLPLIRANRIHVQKVLFNLLRNSIDAMQEAGVLPPAVVVTVSTKKDECFCLVTLQDNGPGIKKEDLRRLFEPFFTTKSKGIGMGLAISRSLIEENDGQLWVDPQEGPGAIFHLTLPFAS